MKSSLGQEGELEGQTQQGTGILVDSKNKSSRAGGKKEEKTTRLILGSMKPVSGQGGRQPQLRISCFSAHLEGRIAAEYMILASGCREVFTQASDPALFAL